MSPCGRERPTERAVTPELLWTLAEECNRHVIRAFHDDDREEMSLEELAEHVAEHHSGRFRDKPKTTAVELHHSSLPKLGELELIEYDPDARVVRNLEEYRLPADLVDQLRSLDDV